MIALYVLVAVVAVGSLPVSTIVHARDYALAEAARPTFGSAGFAMIGVAAMLSTASAINATLYGSARISYVIAKSRELPAEPRPTHLDLAARGAVHHRGRHDPAGERAESRQSISTMGSAGFLIIFAVVNAAEARTSSERGSAAWISIAAGGACPAALAALIARSSAGASAVLGAMVALSFGIEVAFRRVSAAEVPRTATRVRRSPPGRVLARTGWPRRSSR